MAKARLAPAVAFSAVAGLAAACSVAPVDYGSEADAGSSTHALITVERSAVLNSAEAPRAAAFAGFVRTPPDVDANAMLRLAGFGLDLPAVGQCAEPNHDRSNSTPLNPLGRVEFLDAGDVTLRTSTTNAPLATRALPAVTDLIAGVVYTTRDRAADPLPPATTYTMAASGGLLRAFNVNARAPAQLNAVSVDGTPLAELASVGVRSAIALRWEPGSSRDFVYAEFSTQDGSATTRCTFRDNEGVGTVPASAFVGSGLGELSLHRVHSEPFASGSVDAGEVRFDFEQSANVEFTN
ncbi:MAG TPA: hypothetical protein VER11_11635 [Polyangiaceae bacterium]|nr:hypothetical protein [Polyangiaceae bacterium]